MKGYVALSALGFLRYKVSHKPKDNRLCFQVRNMRTIFDYFQSGIAGTFRGDGFDLVYQSILIVLSMKDQHRHFNTWQKIFDIPVFEPFGKQAVPLHKSD